jgi:hypothetical protein
MSEEFSNDVELSSGGEPSEAASIAEGILSEPSVAQEYDAPPMSWKPDVAQRHWRNLDPDLRGYLHSRDKETHEKITQQGHRNVELERFSSRYQPIDGLFEQYRPHIPEGLEPAQAIASLLEAHRLLADPQTRPQAMAQLFEAYGVQNPVEVLPQQYREQFETAQSQLQKTREAESLKAFNEYAEGKPYIQEIMPDIAAEMRTLRQQAPGLDGRTLLRLAHDNVIERSGLKARLDEQAKAEQEGRTVQAQAERLKEMAAQEKKRREEQDRLVKAAKRAAGINVRSSPSTFSAPKTLDEELRTIADRAYRR